MTKTIEIVISPDGQTKVETKGFAGESCRDASRFLEQALGSRINELLTADFHKRKPSTHRISSDRKASRLGRF